MENLYQCPLCKTPLKSENEFHTHYNLFHGNQNQTHGSSFGSVGGMKMKSHKCEFCDYRSDKRWLVVRHRRLMHGSVNVNRPTFPQTNRNISLPTVGYGDAHSETRALQPYVKKLNTENDCDCSETRFPSNVDHKRNKDLFDGDSESVSSSISNSSVGIDYIYERGGIIISRCEELLEEYKTLGSEWKHLCSEMTFDNGASKEERAKFTELMERCAEFELLIRDSNNEDQSETEADETQEYDDEEEVEEEESEEDNEDGEENEDRRKRVPDDESEDEDDEDIEDEWKSDHGVSCFSRIIYDFEDGIENIQWAKDIYEKLKIKGKIDRTIYKKDSESSLDSDTEEENEIEEDTKHLSSPPSKLNKSLKSAIDGVKYEGPSYIKYCPDKIVKHIGTCCNLFWFNNLGLADKAIVEQYMDNIKDIKPSFLKVADPSTPVKKKRKLLMKRQVGNGIFSLLASAVLPTLMGLVLSK